MTEPATPATPTPPKWDVAHVIIVIAFAVGLLWHVWALAAGQALTANTIVPILLVVSSSVWGFFKRPPQSPDQALQQGEGLAKKG